MSRSAADIVSLSSVRETLFIGPLSAFPVQARRVLLRDRSAVRDALHVFLSRPGAEELVRPFLRRWGIDAFAIRVSGRGDLVEVLSLAAFNGAIAVALAPEPVLTFSRTSEDLDARIPLAVAKRDADTPLPDDFLDRLFIVAGMVPEHLEGAVRQEFEALIDTGYEALLVSLVAMMIPGVNLAILGMSIFTLPGQVLEAIDKLVDVLEDIKTAKSASQLQGSAKVAAGVLAVLLREGILRRFFTTKFVIKGMAAMGDRLRKPAPVKPMAQPTRSRVQKSDHGALSPPPVARKSRTEFADPDKSAVYKAETFATKGMSRTAAKKYLKTPEGKKLMEQRVAFHKGDLGKARADVITMLNSCAAKPVMRAASEPLVKIVSPAYGLSHQSPFFTTERELQAAVASGKPLHEYFGLPVRSEADHYRVYRIVPKKDTNVFVAKLASTEELGGKVKKEGGALQVLVPDRQAWSEPEPIALIDGP
ncbi:hypothetical protein [Sinorhizobium fredii]|uniref:hypothetical protein n=1 Tax=Rhizobium fredii TaxID=380 RepID=UPI0004BAF9DB|nr:hypothetical protein [Sinorhizobium fredii]